MGFATDDAIAEVFGDSGAISGFQNSLVAWFRSVGRDYPWRRTKDPYPIFVSEAMLQQTQIATVLGRGYFTRWMEAFPSWGALAAASEEEVLKQWEGLGYYNRARNLKKTAMIVSRDFEGRFPEDMTTILSLPGVGRYTAGALMSFAFDRRAAIVDGNVSRVFSRLFARPEPVDTPAGHRIIWALAETLMPETDPALYNSALMELGQRVCGRSSPKCADCPVQSWCLAGQRGVAVEFPVKKGGRKTTIRHERVLLAVRNRRILLCPESGPHRKGLWRLPEVSSEKSADFPELCRFDYSITQYRVTLTVLLFPAGAGPIDGEYPGARWFPEDGEEEMPPIGSPYRKAIRMFSDYRDDLIVNG